MLSVCQPRPPCPANHAHCHNRHVTVTDTFLNSSVKLIVINSSIDKGTEPSYNVHTDTVSGSSHAAIKQFTSYLTKVTKIKQIL